jgi:hypothetical protein
MAKEKMVRTTIYIPENLHSSLKNVNKSELVRKNLEKWVKDNSKLLGSLLILVMCFHFMPFATADELTIGDNIISNASYIPIEWWSIAFIVGLAMLVLGYLVINYVLELFSTLFLWACAYMAPLVGYFNTQTVLTNSTNMTYTTISTVTMAFQPFVSYLCYGLGALAFFLFIMLLFSSVFAFMKEKKRKSFNNSEVDEFGGWA